MQTSGMTRNPSPVYLLYPPDASGRRPSSHTELQYVSPADRARATNQAGHQATDVARGNNQQYHTNATQPSHTTSSYRPTSYPFTARSGTANSPLLESSTRGAFWYCCHPDCLNRGPYSFALHCSCTAGCQRPRCDRCRTVYH